MEEVSTKQVFKVTYAADYTRNKVFFCNLAKVNDDYASFRANLINHRKVLNVLNQDQKFECYEYEFMAFIGDTEKHFKCVVVKAKQLKDKFETQIRQRYEAQLTRKYEHEMKPAFINFQLNPTTKSSTGTFGLTL